MMYQILFLALSVVIAANILVAVIALSRVSDARRRPFEAGQFADSTARAEVVLKVSTTAGIGVGSTQTRPRRGCDFSSIFSTSGENRLKRDAEKPQRNLFLGVLPPIVSNTILAANRGTGS